jgi:ribosomal protein L11 methyltransferase
VLLKAWFEGTRDYNTLLAELSDALEALGVPTQGTSLTALAEQDWNANWKAGFTAFQLSPRLRIVPSWSNEEDKKPGATLQVDPGMAFGTGTHFTTAGCTQLLDDLLASWPGAAPTLLDVGTGTGILALAGLRLGAASAVGVDADPRAIEASAENARINGLTERLQLFEGGPEAAPPGTFAIVLANLIAPLLSELAATLCSRLAPDASLILSGILCRQEEGIVEAFAKHGLETVQRLCDEEWVALRMTHRAGDPR